MAYGIQTTKGSLTTLSDTLIGGRVFIELIYYETETAGTTHTHTYTSVPGASYLRVHQIGGGTHTWATSTNGSGQAVITLTATANPSSLSVPFTLLIVFATRTSETGYGILTTNSAGDTVVSAIYPVPEYVGKITLSGTASGSYDTGSESLWNYTHDGTFSAGAGRERFILWVLPQTNDNVWFNCPAHISSAVTGTATVSVNVYTPSGTPYYLPQGYVFALTGLAASTDPYGLRVYDASGSPTFDTGRDHLVLKDIENIVDYPTSLGTVNSYTLGSMAGVNFPAGSFPQFRREVFGSGGGDLYVGAVRLRSDQVDTRLVKQAHYGGSYSSASYNYGQYTDLTQAIIDSAWYGGGTTYSLTGRTFQYDGSSYCSYDTSLSQTSCTSVSYHTVRFAGGKLGSSLTFTWSLPSNPGGLSITSGTSGIDVEVSKTSAAGSAYPGTTYSATLRCVISDGLTSATIDRTITHTHEEMTSGGGGGGDTGGDSGGSGDGGGGGCFLTTACVTHLGQQDDGFVLNTLRKFRDEHMMVSEKGKTDVRWYYENAPAIVAALDAKPNTHDLYVKMWNEFILPSVEAINSNQYELAYSIYFNLVVWAANEAGLTIELP